MLNVLNPATGETIAEVPVATPRTSTAPSLSARGAFAAWSNTTPAERQDALLKLADAVEEHSDELAEIEARNAGKPLHAMREDEMPVCVDNLRFFAGAARNLEGKAAGEYLSGLHVLDAPRGGRRRVADHALELPADDGDLEDRPGAGDRQHDRAQARRDDAAVHAAPGRAGQRDPPGRRAERRHRRGRGRPADGHPPRRRHGLADRQRRHRQVDRAGRRRHAQARAPRARRQGAGRGLRRRRPRARWRRRSAAPPTTTPARTARPRPACSRPPACTTTSSRRWPSRPARSSSATPSTPRPRSARSTPPASSAASPASSSAAPTTRASSPAASRPTRPASSSSRP